VKQKRGKGSQWKFEGGGIGKTGNSETMEALMGEWAGNACRLKHGLAHMREGKLTEGGKTESV